MLSWAVHYKNKYPDCRVQMSESSFDVMSKDGSHLLSLAKNGSGQWVDQSEKMGLSERHDLAPIPKDSRVHKVQDGNIGHDEHAEERKSARSKYMEGGKVLSCSELKSKGFDFDEKQRCVAEPK